MADLMKQKFGHKVSIVVTTEGFKQDCLSLLLSLPQVILSVARSPFPQASSPSFFFFFSLSILSFFLTHFYYQIPFNSTILLFYHIPSFLLIETLFTIQYLLHSNPI